MPKTSTLSDHNQLDDARIENIDNSRLFDLTENSNLSSILGELSSWNDRGNIIPDFPSEISSIHPNEKPFYVKKEEEVHQCRLCPPRSVNRPLEDDEDYHHSSRHCGISQRKMISKNHKRTQERMHKKSGAERDSYESHETKRINTLSHRNRQPVCNECKANPRVNKITIECFWENGFTLEVTPKK